MDWLYDITDWFLQAIKDVWKAVVDFLHDLILFALDGVLSLVSIAINALPSPDFLTQYSLDGIIAAAGPTVGWIVVRFRVGEALAIIGAAYAFRLTRKFLTFFQW